MKTEHPEKKREGASENHFLTLSLMGHKHVRIYVLRTESVYLPPTITDFALSVFVLQL